MKPTYIHHLPNPKQARKRGVHPLMMLAIYAGSGMITFAVIGAIYCALR
jgi:hypothetical protein